MSPERLLKEPWRLAVFFTLVFGMMIVCIAVIIVQQERAGSQQTAASRDVRRTQDLVLLALEKSDRNNQTGLEAIRATRQVYEAGEKARGQLMQTVTEEKKMNITLLKMNRCLIQMNRRLLVSQNWMRLHMKRLERRRR